MNHLWVSLIHTLVNQMCTHKFKYSEAFDSNTFEFENNLGILYHMQHLNLQIICNLYSICRPGIHYSKSNELQIILNTHVMNLLLEAWNCFRYSITLNNYIWVDIGWENKRLEYVLRNEQQHRSACILIKYYFTCLCCKSNNGLIHFTWQKRSMF